MENPPTMPSSNRYRYTPLLDGRKIRLLSLRPEEESNVVQISIFDADLDQEPVYEALSYTWGSTIGKIPIFCNEEGHTLPVTRNCEAALRRLRFKAEVRTLWIDAICIDQENIPERGKQVQFMSSIYRQAQRVLAYLGEASDDSQIAMDFILEDAASWSENARPSVGLSLDKKSSPQHIAIENILRRPYFTRIWVIQEVVFAKEVQIILGDSTVDWGAFSSAVYYFNINKQLYLRSRLGAKPPPMMFYRDRSTSLANGGVKTEIPQSLLEFLRSTRHCDASDPRDRIYAVLGMSTDKEESSLAPNYAINTWDVFLNLAKFLINRDKRLDVLCHVQQSQTMMSRASWVPDWSRHEHSDAFGHKNDSVRPYKASLGLDAEVVFEENPETLVARGKVVDIVSDVGRGYQPGSDYWGPDSLKKWEVMVSTLDKNSSFADILIAYPPYPNPNPFARFYPSWRRQTFGGEALDAHENAEATIFQEQVSRACSARALFVTEKGFIGLGPTETKPGELVAVLLGGSVPFVLRREESSFTLAGECYVHGLMNGEAILDDKIDFQMIRLI